MSYNINELQYVSVKDELDHHSKCQVGLINDNVDICDVNGQNKYKTGRYYFVIPQNITKI